MNNKAIERTTAIVCITAIELTGIITGNTDGVFMSAVIGVIAGLSGYSIGMLKNSK